jgi:hypothetical protein
MVPGCNPLLATSLAVINEHGSVLARGSAFELLL